MNDSMERTDHDRAAPLRRLGITGIAMAIIGGSILVFGDRSTHGSFFAAYVAAFVFWFNLTLGSLALALLHGLSGGGWGTTLRRVLEAGYESLPITALTFIPIWLDVARIYEWTNPEVMHHSQTLARKLPYLNVDAWRIRAVVLFAIWFATVAALRFLSPAATTSDDARRAQRLQTVSGLGMFAYVFTVTVAAVDWVMSLEPHWFSSMYGVLYLAIQAIVGLALGIVVVTRFADYRPWRRLVFADRLNDLGNLLFAFTMFWAYVHLMQFLIIWSGDLPEENVWYLQRSRGPWLPILWLLVVAGFIAPFLMLLSRGRKRTPLGLQRTAILLLAMSYASVAWMTMPAFELAPDVPVAAEEAARHDADVVPHPARGLDLSLVWLAPAAWCAIGGLWITWFAWRLAVRSRVPILDHEREETAHDHAARPIAG